MFVNISGSVDGAVWPLHYADIQLKHPEKRFKEGSSIKCRVGCYQGVHGSALTITLIGLCDRATEGKGQVDLEEVSGRIDGHTADIFRRCRRRLGHSRCRHEDF